MSWRIPDIGPLKIMLNVARHEGPKWIPRPVMPKLPDELKVTFSPDGNTRLNPADPQMMNIKRWIDRLRDGNDLAAIRDLLVAK